MFCICFFFSMALTKLYSHLDIWTFGHLDFGTVGLCDFGTFELWDFGTYGHWDFGTVGLLDVWTLGLLGIGFVFNCLTLGLCFVLIKLLAFFLIYRPRCSQKLKRK